MNSITIKDLLPDYEDLVEMARCSLSGDSIVEAIGTHKGRNITRKDTMGLTKRTVYQFAISGDTCSFERFAKRLKNDPFNLPPSIRTMIPKDIDNPSKGQRPIDDPAEMKRLTVLFVRKKLEPLFESQLTHGQLGGRQAEYIDKICCLKGATAQDQVAVGIHRAIWDGLPFCLSIDLENAFGNVPKEAAVRAFRNIGCDKQASEWLWRIIRIDAVDSRTRKKIDTEENIGIEQGNPLSATVMNLVLAPIFKRLESQMQVRIFSYLDDIYIMADTFETAQKAYTLFTHIANKDGFKNIRRLWMPGDDNNSKLSKIIDLNKEMLDVLKTYKVYKTGIALHPDKVKESLKNNLIRANCKYSFPDLKKIFNCRSLTKKACREVVPEILKKGKTKARIGLSYPSSTGELVGYSKDLYKENDLHIKSDLQIDDNFDLHKGNNSFDESQPSTYIHDQLILDISGTCTSPIGILENVDHSMDYWYKIDSPWEDNRDTVNYLTGTVEPYNDYLLYSSHDCLSFQKSQFNGNQYCSKLYNELNFHNRACTCIEWGDTQDRRSVPAVEGPTSLSIFSIEDIRRFLSTPKGNFDYSKHKGSTLDLRCLKEVINTDAKNLIPTINRLIKAVRVYEKARIIIDPCDKWTSRPEILGLSEDNTYKRIDLNDENFLHSRPDGSIVIELLHKRKRRKNTCRPQGINVPDADMIIEHISKKSICRFEYKLRLTQNKKKRTEILRTSAPNDVAGALQAVGYVLEQQKPDKVAIYTNGYTQICNYLPDKNYIPKHVALSECFEWLRKHYKWTVVEGMVTGKRRRKSHQQ